MVLSSTGSLKVALRAIFVATLLSKLLGVVATIVGGVVSGGSAGPFLPQPLNGTSAVRTHIKARYKLFFISGIMFVTSGDRCYIGLAKLF
jgi:hypothetical protein